MSSSLNILSYLLSAVAVIVLIFDKGRYFELFFLTSALLFISARIIAAVDSLNQRIEMFGTKFNMNENIKLLDLISTRLMYVEAMLQESAAASFSMSEDHSNSNELNSDVPRSDFAYD